MVGSGLKYAAKYGDDVAAALRHGDDFRGVLQVKHAEMAAVAAAFKRGKDFKSAKLGKNLVDAGWSKPGLIGFDAHHLVAPGAMPGAATHLKSLGVDLDSAANGVWLPRNATFRKDLGVNPKTITHANITNRYYEDVGKQILNIHSKAEVEAYLAGLRQKLLDGTYPKEWTTVAE